MNFFYLLFYNLFLWLYRIGAHLSGIFNKKAHLWVSGRQSIFIKLKKIFKNNTSPIIWFHCASLGEFEQGRPLIETFKKEYPKYKIIVTFFSPSGYEIRKDYPLADWVFYLPLDGKINAYRFLSIVKPSMVFFVKYEFWYFYLSEIKRRNIPLYLVSGLFRESQIFFKWYGQLQRKMLDFFTHIFLQNENSARLLASINIHNTTVTGDTRFDRVMATKQNWTEVEKIKEFCEDKQVLVAGSTWEEDDLVIKHFAVSNPDVRFIIAPHEINADRIKECAEIYEHAILYSQYHPEKKYENINTLIIDNIGMLSRLYKYATVSYVGGAFGENGIHNVLEPLIFGTPIIYGPIFDKFPEAAEIAEIGVGHPVDNALEFDKVIQTLLKNPEHLSAIKQQAAIYVSKNLGATDKVFDYIAEALHQK